MDLDSLTLSKLQKLNEKDLRKEIVIPFLKEINAQNVYDTHGSTEFGIDIFFQWFDIFNIQRSYGIQLKAEDIRLDTSKPNKTLMTILQQIELAFNRRIPLIVNKTEAKIEAFYLITSGKFTSNAKKYILDNAHKCSSIFFIDGEKLTELIKNKNKLEIKNKYYETPINLSY